MWSVVKLIAITLLTAIMASSAWPHAAGAAVYPVSGRWTYDDFSGAGAAKTCGTRVIEFRYPQRFDTEGGVSQYRNVSVDRSTSTTYRVIDEFFNVQIRGWVSYTLRVVDQYHIELHLDNGNKTIRLRRCG